MRLNVSEEMKQMSEKQDKSNAEIKEELMLSKIQETIKRDLINLIDENYENFRKCCR